MANIAICGQGRIGTKVSDELSQQGHKLDIVRLDKDLGLVSPSGAVSGDIELLIICISSAKKRGIWDWSNIFDGLIKQVSQGELTVKDIIFVSSTRVYDGIETGLVSAQTPAKSNSDRGKRLLTGEQKLEQACANLHLIRCSGLIGQGYDSYQPILREAQDKPRFAINTEKVIELIVQQAQLLIDKTHVAAITLMTDGKAYYQQKSYDLAKDKAIVTELAQQFRVLVPGQN